MLRKCLFFLLPVFLFACTIPESQLETDGSIDQDIPETRGVQHIYSLPCWGTEPISRTWTMNVVVGNKLYWEYGGSATPNIAHEFTIKKNGMTVARYYDGMTPFTRKDWFYAQSGDILEISMTPLEYCYNPYNCYDWVFGIITVKDISF
jgi:hypothetical protein